MTEAEQTIREVILSLLERRDAANVDVTSEANLYDDLGLDSLEVAELSAALEDDLGRDPFTEGIVPSTVGELVAFYHS